MDGDKVKAWVLFDPYYHEIKPYTLFKTRKEALLYALKLEKNFKEYRQIREVEIDIK